MKRTQKALSPVALAALAAASGAQIREHVDPQMVVRARGSGSTSEAGVGALIPWADRLWAVGYVAHISGDGLGLYEIGADMKWKRRPESVTGTYANRFVHWPSRQVVIGPHVIDDKGKVRTFKDLVGHRLAGTAAHLTDRDQVYMLTMEGLLFEANVRNLGVRRLFDLTKELDWTEGAYLHFKGIHTGHGRVVVANNTFEEPEFLGKRRAGRLAEWTGGNKWTILERNPFIEVSGNQTAQAGDYFGAPLYAVGWDEASVILRVLHRGTWKRYRLPFGSASWMHTWNTEWMRIRFAQTERLLMDAFGIFYDLPNLVYGGNILPIRPISTHLRVVPDFVHFNGYFVMGSDQVDHTTGQPQSGLWWGNIDDLHRFGKPSGFGALWRDAAPEPGAPSDPYLMTGFDQKSVHLTCAPDSSVEVDLEVDPSGTGEFRKVATLKTSEGYAYHVFPAGFSAHWMRARVRQADGPSTLSIHYQ